MEDFGWSIIAARPSDDQEEAGLKAANDHQEKRMSEVAPLFSHFVTFEERHERTRRMQDRIQSRSVKKKVVLKFYKKNNLVSLFKNVKKKNSIEKRQKKVVLE